MKKWDAAILNCSDNTKQSWRLGFGWSWSWIGSGWCNFIGHYGAERRRLEPWENMLNWFPVLFHLMDISSWDKTMLGKTSFQRLATMCALDNRAVKCHITKARKGHRAMMLLRNKSERFSELLFCRDQKRFTAFPQANPNDCNSILY